LLPVSFQSGFIAQFVFVDKGLNMVPVSLNYIGETLSVLTNLNDVLGGMVCCWI
jgi:hypothetical protein